MYVIEIEKEQGREREREGEKDRRGPRKEIVARKRALEMSTDFVLRFL